jgi:hypothetical protein
MIAQCTYLVCKKAFGFKVNGKGRMIVFKEGQRFWVGNTPSDQTKRGQINVIRKGYPLGFGYDFAPSQVSEYFHQEQ